MQIMATLEYFCLNKQLNKTYNIKQKNAENKLKKSVSHAFILAYKAEDKNLAVLCFILIL